MEINLSSVNLNQQQYKEYFIEKVEYIYTLNKMNVKSK